MNDVRVREISQLITTEVQLMTSLLDVLQLEEQTLVDNNAEKLEQVTSQKNLVLGDIIAIEKQRNQLLSQLGYSIDSEGIKSFLDTTTSTPSVEQSWNTLLELSAKAKENNRTNGLLIGRQMARNQSALNTLQQSDQTGGVYGADGQARSNLGSGRGIIAG